MNRLAVLLAASAALSASAADLRLSLDEYRDRMEGAWLGQSVGVAYGWPTEFTCNGCLVPDDKMPVWKPESVNGTFTQDDLYVEMTFIETLERRGIDVSSRLASIDFANSLYSLWCANFNARNNLRSGIAAPWSGDPAFHRTTDDIDYQIEADFSGILSPGLPGRVLRLGEQFGRIMNFGDGVYAGEFVGCLYAFAYFERDRVRIVERALGCIPPESRYAEMVRDLLAWYRADPKDWKGAWRKAVDKWQAKQQVGCVSMPAIDVKTNGAMALLGFLWGEGDMGRTMRIATAAGYDSDCNPSTACGVLGTMLGAKGIPAEYVSAFDRTRKWQYTNYDLPGLMRACEGLTRKLVAAEGGRVERGADGRELFVIPEKKAVPVACVSPDKDDPRARFTDAELAEIRYLPGQYCWQSPERHPKTVPNPWAGRPADTLPREEIEWQDRWVESAAKHDAKLPRVLMLGDSISRQYRGEVSRLLKGKAVIANSAGSHCVGDPLLIEEAEKILDAYDFAVIVFNNGLHGFGNTDGEYGMHLPQYVEYLKAKAPKARLIWARTTPVSVAGDLAKFADLNARVEARNRSADEVMKRYGVPTVDLYAPIAADPAKYHAADGTHFNDTGVKVLAKAVADAVLVQLEGLTE